MPLAQALQNLLFLSFPAAAYALLVRWRWKLSATEIRTRLGFKMGNARPWTIAIIAAVPTLFLGSWLSTWTKGFQGSTLAPFVDQSPSLAILAGAINYGFIATGFPEELLFRGLVAGALFRRLPFWKANAIQALIFLLPHLLILLVAPSLWAMAIIFPLMLGLFAGWLRFTSGSFYPAALIHTAGNIAGALAVLNW